jgi:hypothetical protein
VPACQFRTFPSILRDLDESTFRSATFIGGLRDPVHTAPTAFAWRASVKKAIATMPQFFDLPRELRDIVYMAIITWERPRPKLEENSTWCWRDTGCYFAPEEPPKTCANILAASRQLNNELRQSIHTARKAGMLVVRMDCMVENERNHFFTWLSIPLVHSTNPVPSSKSVCGWASCVPVLGRWLAGHQYQQPTKDATTSIEKLQMDIRLSRKDLARSQTLHDVREQTTSWAVCAALKTVCQHRRELSPPPNWPEHVVVDTLVLNIIPHDGPADDSPVRKDSMNAGQADSTVKSHDADDARIVARELVDVWNKLWSGDGFSSRQFSKLLERIKRVQVCIDGVLIGERALRLELERGQAERRRIAQRVGW